MYSRERAQDIKKALRHMQTGGRKRLSGQNGRFAHDSPVTDLNTLSSWAVKLRTY
jgi:hypothetical protein